MILFEMTPSDVDLLEEFVRRRSDAAFAIIVERYSNLVFAAAKRQVRYVNFASAALQVVVNPLPFTQIMISDLQPDGTLRFTDVNQELNLNGRPMTEDRFMSSDFMHVEKMADDQGKSLRFTASHQGNMFQYRCMLNEPVQPGDAELFSSSGSVAGLVRSVGARTSLYTMTQEPGSNFPTRRVELLRLPADATLICASPNLTSRVVDGRTQMLLDVIILPGGGNTVTFRYRLAGANWIARESPGVILSSTTKVEDGSKSGAINEAGHGFPWPAVAAWIAIRFSTNANYSGVSAPTFRRPLPAVSPLKLVPEHC